MDPILDIVSIQGTGNFNTSNAKGTWGTAKATEHVLWTKSDPTGLNEAASGSTRCITFLVAKDTTSTLSTSLAISLTGTSALLPTWYKSGNPPPPPATFKVFAGLNGRDYLLESEEIKILTPSPMLQVTELRLRQPLYDIPFRSAGDWSWYIERTDIKSVPQASSTRTRLELCFVFAQHAPHGPLEIDSHDAKIETQPDFQDVYPIDLFRMFLPSHWDLIDNEHRGLLQWYVDRVVEVIWKFGFQGHPEFSDRPVTRYDVGAGRSFYLSNGDGVARQDFCPEYGGVFDLLRWSNGIYGYCNAADLVALAQLACALLLTPDGKPLIKPRWIVGRENSAMGQHNFGYIKGGALFGWTHFPQCNSTIWSNGGRPTYLPDENSKRTSLPWHVWLEVTFPEDPINTQSR